MRLHDSAFWFIVFFISGAAAAFYLSPLFIFLISFCFAIIFFSISRFVKAKKRFIVLSFVSFALFLGGTYCVLFNHYQRASARIIFDRKIEFSGVVADIKKKEKGQNILVDLNSPHNGRVEIYARQYPFFKYGDELKISGIINRPDGNPGYYLKNNIRGIASFPQIEITGKDRGNKIKTALLKIKSNVVESFNKGLDYEKAALISGIVIGERADFSQDLKDNMSKSGTTHIVALSGYNISVIVKYSLLLFLAMFSRKISFWLSTALVALFVVMAGAEASIVRAAIMGFLILFAGNVGRVAGVRNIMAIAAFLMILPNPNLILFDLGFQLSFLAFFGLVYIGPYFLKLFKGENGNAFLDWKENLSATISAQIGVLPLILSQFGSFPISSVFANMLILGFMPFTMALGFAYAALSFFSDFLSWIVSFPLSALLEYELWIIKFFGMHYAGINIKINFIWMAVYYGLVFAAIYFKQIKELILNIIERARAKEIKIQNG